MSNNVNYHLTGAVWGTISNSLAHYIPARELREFVDEGTYRPVDGAMSDNIHIAVSTALESDWYEAYHKGHGAAVVAAVFRSVA